METGEYDWVLGDTKVVLPRLVFCWSPTQASESSIWDVLGDGQGVLWFVMCSSASARCMAFEDCLTVGDFDA